MYRVAIVLTLLLLTGCSTSQCSSQTPTPSPFISEQQAIEIALENASMGHPEVGAAKIPPTNVQAEQVTLAAAEKRFSGNDTVPVSYAPNMIVWFVSMDGIWTDGFPRPTDVPTPEPLHHFSIIIDARTGQVLAIGARR